MAAAHRDERVDPLTEYLLWQTVVGAWPISAERLVGYALKAVREAKLHTAWVDGDLRYEAAVARFCTGIATDADVAAHRRLAHGHCTGDSSKHLGPEGDPALMPGVPDLYQGSDLVDLSLVDPDNRRPVDYARRGTGWTDSMPGAAAPTWPTRSSSSPRRRCGSGVSGPRVFVGAEAGYQPLRPRASTPWASAADPVDRTTCWSSRRVVRRGSGPRRVG